MNKEISTNGSSSTSLTTLSSPWEAELNIVNRMKVIIPVKLLLICNQIAARVGGNEFSIVTNILEKTASKIILTDEFYIPKQKVTPGSIDYIQDDYPHKVCIHRHPDGLNTFSGTDKEYINQNFQVSLLYTREDGFVSGIYNHKANEDTLIQLPVEIHIDYDLEVVDISNIQYDDDSEYRSRRNNLERKYSPEFERLTERREDPTRTIEEKTINHELEFKEFNEKVEGDIEMLESRIDMLEESVYYQRFDVGNF